MKRLLSYLTIWILIGVLASIAIAGTMPLRGNNLLETKIGGIKLFDKKAMVYQRLGKPYKSSYDRFADSTDLYYKGLEVEIDNKGYVIELESTSSKFPIYRGMKVGDKKSKLLKLYGKPSFTDNSSKYIQYNSTQYQGWVYCIRFYISKEKVTKINLFDPWGNGM